MAYLEDFVNAGGWSGERLGRHLRRSLGAPREVDVVFCLCFLLLQRNNRKA